MKVLHLCVLDKFIPPFIEMMRENFDTRHHLFVIIGDREKHPYKEGQDTIHLKSFKKDFLMLIKEMNKADKIILHSLFNMRVVQLLFFQPWLLKKCYWVVWGGDLYTYQFSERNWLWYKDEFFRRPVIKNMGHLVTYIEGDYKLAKRWYGTKGQYKECLMYSSNLYKEYNMPEKQDDTINVLLGNSADPSNNHLDILEKLEKYIDQNTLIYCPLSYGNMDYAKEVANKGRALFGDKFVPLFKFLSFKEYLELLGQIDIAIFAHKRQQAMGNIITLLGLGKKVYLRSDITPWSFFNERGVKVFDINQLNLSLIERETGLKNQKAIKHYFSEEMLFAQWESLVGDN